MEQMKQQNKKPVVVGIGELLWDLLPTGKTAGGAPINFVYHASRLGAEGYAISAIGDDDNGRDILSELNKYKIQYLTLNPQLHSRSATYIKRNGLLIRKITIKSSRPFQCAYHPLTP